MKRFGALTAVCLILALPALLFAQSSKDDAAVMVFGGVMAFVYIIVALLMVISTWKVFDKAGKPGWACLIPIYNAVVMMQIAGKPEWWVILMFVPFANIVVLIMMELGIAENFGKSTGFALGLIFLPLIFWPVLAFGDARYAARLNPGEHPVAL